VSDASQGPAGGRRPTASGTRLNRHRGIRPATPEQAPEVVAAHPHPRHRAALSYGWNKFVQYIGQIILIILIIFGVQIAFNLIGNVISGGIGGFTGLFLSLVFSVAGLMISFILQAGLIESV